MAISATDRNPCPVSIEPGQFFLCDNLNESLPNLLGAIQPRCLVHLAGNAEVQRSVANPKMDFDSGVGLFSAVLEAVRTHSPNTRVLLASSAAVYGQAIELPITETAKPNPISPYGYHKWMCELLAKEYSSIYGLATASVRIFSAFGPGLRKQILWDLCKKCASGDEVLLAGDGSESRDFIHSADIAAAILTILDRADFNGEIWNVAAGRETTIASLASRILIEFGLPANRLRFSGQIRIGDPRNWRADISRLQSLGFSPRITIDQGVTEYVSWFKTVS